MPHIVFDRGINLKSLHDSFQNVLLREDVLIRFNDSYINSQKNTILINTTVIDSISQNFFIELSSSDKKTTIRLYPKTDPQKTDGVKRSLCLAAKLILDTEPTLKIIRTNISEYIFPVIH